MNQESIDNIRKVMGTMPSENPTKVSKVETFMESVEVNIEDCSANPYKAMFVSATSTWGDDSFKRKWPITSNEGKLEVIKAVLTHNTLPQAKEMVYFVFRVKGVPRWLFDYHTQIPFTTFMSVGCRDNNKLDSKNVIGLYDSELNIEETLKLNEVIKDLKDLYSENLNLQNQCSWQSARAFLLQSYSHSYHFGQNMLSIVGTKGFHASRYFDLNNKKDLYLSHVYKKVCSSIYEKFPLLGDYLDIMFCRSKIEQEEIFYKIKKLTVKDLSSKDIELFNID